MSTPPQRIVSLVPSLTESVFDLGLGSRLIGITEYCIHPAGRLEGLPRLGGTKNPDIAGIIALQPDLILANQEENTPQAVAALQAAGLEVWVTFPKTVGECLEMLRLLAERMGSSDALLRVATMEKALDWAVLAAQEQPPIRYFCPIWMDDSPPVQRWWMTFNDDTYCASLLNALGGKNVFGERQRRYPLAADLGKIPPENPGQRDTRYPRVLLEEIQAANPDVILLPDEPYAFKEAQQQEFLTLLRNSPAAKEGQIHLVDGTLITWTGTRLAKALQILPAYFVQP